MLLGMIYFLGLMGISAVVVKVIDSTEKGYKWMNKFAEYELDEEGNRK